METSSKPIHPENEGCEHLLKDKFEYNCSDPNDRPLSPVLMSCNLNRKHLLVKKGLHKRSRTRLTERFQGFGDDWKQNSREGEESIKSKPELFTEEDFTLSQTENILSCLDRLEEIQKNREQAYKLVVSSKNCDFPFKKPISPAPKKLRCPHTVPESTSLDNESSDLNHLEDKEPVTDKFVTSYRETVESRNCTSFQTASGKTIRFSELDLNKHASLFDDILTPSQDINARKTKHNFLKREVSSKINLKNSTEFTGSEPPFPKPMPDYNEQNSLTTEIYESDVSNSQMLVAAETILKELETETLHNDKTLSADNCDEFKGFNKLEKNKSFQFINNFHNNFNNNISNKRRHSGSNDDIHIKRLKEDFLEQSISYDDPCSKDQKNLASLGAPGKMISRTIEHSFDELNLVQKTNPNRVVSLCREKEKPSFTTTTKQSEHISKQNSVSSIKSKLKYFDDLIGDTACNVTDFKTENNSGINKPSVNVFETSKKPPLETSEIKKPLNGLKDKLAFFDKMLDNTEFDNLSMTKTNELAFSNASGRVFMHHKPITAQAKSTNELKKFAVNGLADTNSLPLKTSFDTGFSTASGKSYQLSKKALNKASALFDDLNSDLENVPTPQKPLSFTTNQQGTYDTPKRKNSFESSSAKKSNRKLGITSCKPIAISADKLNIARQMFVEEFGSVSPIKPIQSISNMSTPILKNQYGTPIGTNEPINSFREYSNETITTSGVVEKYDSKEYKLAEDSVVTFVDPENQCDMELATELDNERERLEKRLKIVIARQEALTSLEYKKWELHKKPCPGKLYQKKLKCSRIPIATLVAGQTNDGTCDLFFISPQNAEFIHFKEYSSVVVTEDGATVIPNSKDLIGLREIESSIKSMPCVEERLIPKNWIRNHYKWIIWKLASYERMFPILFKGFLNVEYVIQHLKYRYDREIDKAERPAIRRICEKDDAPQKRMVLCVSNIRKVESDRFELELTDGWYGIRTVIDDMLCNQVRNGKIKIGTKLIVSGAELMNCDGCSPLELTDSSFLKINYNSTRRAIWNARLGYQRFPGPFSIQIRTVLPSGGTIGAIEICIARLYPMKYLEKIGGRAVWRNKRSEERSAQAWEMEQSRRMEDMEERIRNEFSDMKTSTDHRRINAAQDISKISNPEILMDIIESSNDPEGVQDKLSSLQKTAILEYRQNSFARKVQEMSAKAKEGAEKLKVAKRDVVSVLKMLVVDINGSPTTAFSFFVWRPTESHFHVLREGSCIKAYNVLPRMNGDLSAGSKTLFRSDDQKDQISDIFKRKLIEISDVSDRKFSVNFSEFDTVGLVVRMKIEENHQEIWLTNVSGRLLLVDIYEGPNTCLSLDKLKRGQPITVCNLMYKGMKQDFVRASANHFSIFSPYSQFKHLQEGLDRFLTVLPKDCDRLLQECDKKIESINMSPNTSKNVSVTHVEDCDEDELEPYRITSTDIALSLLDIDKLS